MRSGRGGGGRLALGLTAGLLACGDATGDVTSGASGASTQAVTTPGDPPATPTSSSTGSSTGANGSTQAGPDASTSADASAASTTDTCPLGQMGCGCSDGGCDRGLECAAGICGPVAAVCGDARVDPGEACDDGNADDDDACLTTCVAASCGDGFVHAGAEECDDGNAVDTDACPSTCLLASCGDGFIQLGVEACDDGNAVDTDACRGDCEAASCGDGVVEAGVEACDDGNASDTDACLSTCLLASCGDGFVHAEVEECDDGNADAGDGCTAACLFECGDDCWSDHGCLTAGGRCIRFSCTPGDTASSACKVCFGWKPVSLDDWLSQGYCLDVTAKYRSVHGHETRCGGAPVCCASPGACGGGDGGWHFFDGEHNRLVGPCLNCQEPDDCTHWNEVYDGIYSRLTACTR